MDHELKVHPETVFFVATDDVGSRNQFLERFSSEKIIFSELEKAERKTLKGIKGALYEMLLLSKTHHIIGTTMSSFSDLAAMMTESSRKITIGNSPYRGDPLKTFCFARPTGILAPCDVNLETMRHYRPQP